MNALSKTRKHPVLRHTHTRLTDGCGLAAAVPLSGGKEESLRVRLCGPAHRERGKEGTMSRRDQRYRRGANGR